MNLFIRS